MYEAIVHRDERRIMEAILELNSFLIKYRLKPNELNNFAQEDTSKMYENQKVETFKFIIENFAQLQFTKHTNF